MKIVISGLGAMGASLALALRNEIPDIVIAGHDFPEVEQLALREKIIDEIIAWPLGCKNSEVIFLATPIDIIRKQLSELNGIVGSDTIVSDLGSTKAALSMKARRIHFSGCYIGGHPMTGAEKSGLKAANPLMYENAVYVLTPQDDVPLSRFKKLTNLLEKIKSRVFIIDPERHDQVMAYISHLPQMIATALVNTVGEKNSSLFPCFPLAAGGFRDLTRIASSSSDMWQPIADTNSKNILDAIDSFIAQLRLSKKSLADLEKNFSKANDFRSNIPRQGKGFLSPLTDVLVYVNDEKGVIAKIANALFDKGIDIRDIELLKIREKEGGVFRLSFDSEKHAEQAITILESIQYKAFLKE